MSERDFRVDVSPAVKTETVDLSQQRATIAQLGEDIRNVQKEKGHLEEELARRQAHLVEG